LIGFRRDRRKAVFLYVLKRSSSGTWLMSVPGTSRTNQPRPSLSPIGLTTDKGRF